MCTGVVQDLVRHVYAAAILPCTATSDPNPPMHALLPAAAHDISTLVLTRTRLDGDLCPVPPPTSPSPRIDRMLGVILESTPRTIVLALCGNFDVILVRISSVSRERERKQRSCRERERET